MMQVVRNLILSYDIINSTDAQGNTALHVASYRGYLPVVEILIQASPSLTTLTNHYGDTFLHMAVAGFRSPGFCRMEKHTELMKNLLSEKIVNMRDIINVRNNDGRTALHVAVIHDVQCDVVELLMSIASVNLNIRDADGMTPLDHLKQRPRSASSEILIKQLISAGGISDFSQDHIARNFLVSRLKNHGFRGSPGTSFRISDAEIFLYTSIENENSSEVNFDHASVESNSCSSELNNYDSDNSSNIFKSCSANTATRRLTNLLQWPRRRESKPATSVLEDDDSVDSFNSRKKLEDFPIPLRQRYSKQCSLPNNKRTLSIKTLLPSPSAKEYFTAGLMQGVIKVKPHGHVFSHSISSPFQELSISSHSPNNKQKCGATMGTSCSNQPMKYKQSPISKKLMNRYFSFGAHGQAKEDGSSSCTITDSSYKSSGSLVA